MDELELLGVLGAVAEDAVPDAVDKDGALVDLASVEGLGGG